VKSPSGRSLISAIAVAKGDSNLVWVGHEDGQVFKTVDGASAKPTWTTLQGLPQRYCTRIIVTPKNPQQVFATFAGYQRGNLYVTPNGGATWTTVGAGVLPEVPYYDLAIHPDNAKILILGSEVGLFVSDDAGDTWSPTNQGPTNAPVYKLFWMDKTLVAVTHGRGLFKIDLSRAGQPPAPRASRGIAP